MDYSYLCATCGKEASSVDENNDCVSCRQIHDFVPNWHYQCTDCQTWYGAHYFQRDCEVCGSDVGYYVGGNFVKFAEDY